MGKYLLGVYSTHLWEEKNKTKQSPFKTYLSYLDRVSWLNNLVLLPNLEGGEKNHSYVL